jgi:hypothetical protein
MHSEIGRSNRPLVWLALSCIVAAFAYLPILNNGFIADDYVILKRIELLKIQPFYLYQVPPENFRFLSYVIFGVFKALAGYQAWPFYAFNIGLHLTNVVLLWRLLRLLIDDEITVGLAALFFGVFQAPQKRHHVVGSANEATNVVQPWVACSAGGTALCAGLSLRSLCFRRNPRLSFQS